MRGHSTIHHSEKNQRILQKVRQIVEQHVTETTTQKHAEKCAADDEIGNPFYGDVAESQARETPNDEDSEDECGDISQSIPSQAEVAAEAEEKGLRSWT